MVLLALLLACEPPSQPASSGSRSADLAVRSGNLGRGASALAGQAADIEGEVDAWRAASPEQRPEIEARIRATAEDLRVNALRLSDEVTDLEAGARAFDTDPPP